jgi:hypothetical protein
MPALSISLSLSASKPLLDKSAANGFGIVVAVDSSSSFIVFRKSGLVNDLSYDLKSQKDDQIITSDSKTDAIAEKTPYSLRSMEFLPKNWALTAFENEFGRQIKR